MIIIAYITDKSLHFSHKSIFNSNNYLRINVLKKTRYPFIYTDSQQETILLLSSLSDDFLFLLFVLYIPVGIYLYYFPKLHIRHLPKKYLMNLYQLIIWEKSKDFQCIFIKWAGYKKLFL